MGDETGLQSTVTGLTDSENLLPRGKNRVEVLFRHAFVVDNWDTWTSQDDCSDTCSPNVAIDSCVVQMEEQSS